LTYSDFLCIYEFGFLVVHLQNASLEDIQKNIRELDLDDNRKKELACALHAQFKDWLYGKFSYIDITVMIE
jgi:hypothetical protein